jgi:hypothetical protein
MLGFGLVLVAFGMIAVVDHRLKQSRVNHAELLEWYCAHRATRCGGPSADRIESHWSQRQVAYEWGIGLFALAGVVFLVRPTRTPGVEHPPI